MTGNATAPAIECQLHSNKGARHLSAPWAGTSHRAHAPSQSVAGAVPLVDPPRNISRPKCGVIAPQCEMSLHADPTTQ